VAEPAVVNASPLVFLTRVGLLQILRLAGEPVVVPRAVVDEIKQYGPADRTAAALRAAGWLKEVDPIPIPPAIETWDLGSGETSVLAWAIANPGSAAVLDDLAARRCAASLAIPVRGTLGLILTAKRRGVIAEARPVLQRLRAAGMYLSDNVMERALKTVGE